MDYLGAGHGAEYCDLLPRLAHWVGSGYFSLEASYDEAFEYVQERHRQMRLHYLGEPIRFPARQLRRASRVTPLPAATRLGSVATVRRVGNSLVVTCPAWIASQQDIAANDVVWAEFLPAPYGPDLEGKHCLDVSRELIAMGILVGGPNLASISTTEQ
ncbi:MAG: hypothetical protein QOK05_522 [Chloroflexota bacterium]|nr:hypothetical protein [Chloroflexota bacterium]